MRRVSSVFGGALIMTVSTLIIKIIGVFYKIPLSYILGDEGMGYFNSAYAVYGFFYVIASAGVPKSITMLVARFNDEDDERAFVVKRLLRLFAAMGLAVSVLFILLARPISLLVGNERSLSTMLAIAPSLLFITLSGVIRGYLNGISRLSPIAISQLIEAVSKLILGLCFATLGYKLGLPLYTISSLAILGITLGSFFSLLYIYVVCFPSAAGKTVPKAGGLLYKNALRTVIKTAIPITLSAAISSASGIIDLGMVIRGLISSGYSEEAANAAYGNYSTLAVPMIGLVSSLLLPISLALLPKLASSHSTDEFKDTLGMSWEITLLLATPIFCGYFLYSFDILDILFPSFTSAIGADSLTALSFAALLLPLLTVVNTALEANGRVGNALLSMSIGVLLKTIINALLIPNCNFGIVGAAFGTVISYAFSIVFSMLLLGKERNAIRFWRSILVIFLGVLAFFPAFVFVYRINLCANSVLSMLLALSISGLCYLAFVFGYALKPILKKRKHHNAQKENALF